MILSLIFCLESFLAVEGILLKRDLSEILMRTVHARVGIRTDLRSKLNLASLLKPRSVPRISIEDVLF